MTTYDEPISMLPNGQQEFLGVKIGGMYLRTKDGFVPYLENDIGDVYKVMALRPVQFGDVPSDVEAILYKVQEGNAKRHEEMTLRLDDSLFDRVVGGYHGSLGI